MESKVLGVYFFNDFIYIDWIIADKFNCAGDAFACVYTLLFYNSLMYVIMYNSKKKIEMFIVQLYHCILE